MTAISIRRVGEAIAKRVRIWCVSSRCSTERRTAGFLPGGLDSGGQGLGTTIHERFRASGGVSLPAADRSQTPRKADRS